MLVGELLIIMARVGLMRRQLTVARQGTGLGPRCLITLLAMT